MTLNIDLMQNPNISLIGFFLASNGLGQSARNIAYSLDTTSLAPAYVDIKSNLTRGSDEFINKCSKYLPDKINFVIAGIDLAESITRQISSMGSGKKNYFYPYWELERIPLNIIEAISIYDKIVAPSQFIADTFQKYVDHKVEVISQPVFIPHHINVNRIENGVLRIFFMMDLRSYVSRKNPTGALEAFKLAFPPNIKDVVLIIKIKGGRDFGLRNELAAYCSKDSRIKVIDGHLHRDEITLLMNKCNVFLSLHRSEGFGFGPAEALASGKILVATQYGGVTDFLNESTGYPIPYKMIPVKENEYPYGNNQMWADPSLLHAASALQEIYKNFNQALERANAGRQLMINKFSFKSIGEKLENFFDLNNS